MEIKRKIKWSAIEEGGKKKTKKGEKHPVEKGIKSLI